MLRVDRGGLQVRIDVILVPVDGGDKVEVPVHYNKALQGLIYSQLRDRIPTIHHNGWESKGRAFRMFVYSRLLGQIEKIRQQHIHFLAPIRFSVASPSTELIEALADGFLKAPNLRLVDKVLDLEKLSVYKTPDLSGGHILCRALSPVTVYSTVTTAEGRKKTYYYHPAEAEFKTQVENNLRKKAEALGILGSTEKAIRLECVRTQARDQKVVFYDRTVIKGWMGTFELSGDPTMLALALDAGIGAKNSQGFGMLQVIRQL